jgi:hypothetical protein
MFDALREQLEQRRARITEQLDTSKNLGETGVI